MVPSVLGLIFRILRDLVCAGSLSNAKIMRQNSKTEGRI